MYGFIFDISFRCISLPGDRASSRRNTHLVLTELRPTAGECGFLWQLVHCLLDAGFACLIACLRGPLLANESWPPYVFCLLSCGGFWEGSGVADGADAW